MSLLNLFTPRGNLRLKKIQILGHHTEKIAKKKFAWKATLKICNKAIYGMKFMKLIL